MNRAMSLWKGLHDKCTVDCLGQVKDTIVKKTYMRGLHSQKFKMNEAVDSLLSEKVSNLLLT